MRRIIIIAGPNGAGKTTFATEYLQQAAGSNSAGEISNSSIGRWSIIGSCMIIRETPRFFLLKEARHEDKTWLTPKESAARRTQSPSPRRQEGCRIRAPYWNSRLCDQMAGLWMLPGQHGNAARFTVRRRSAAERFVAAAVPHALARAVGSEAVMEQFVPCGVEVGLFQEM
jgi:hypothetical protein